MNFMGVITKNGDNIIDFNLFTKKYGCIKVEFKQQEGERYYLYAFRNDLSEWDFDKGELILVTHNEDKVKEIASKVLTLYAGEVFCKECFRKKDVARLSNKNTSYWCHYFWEKTPLHTKKLLQNEILYSIPDINWPMVKNITTDKSYVLFGVCSDSCMTREEYDNDVEFQKKKKLMDDIWEELITEEVLTNGPEVLLEELLCDHIEVIEEGMSFVERQYKVENGIIDIIAKDKNGTKCIIELKVVADDKSLAWQSAYYPSCFDEDVRMITIAPNYTDRIYNALKNISNVEMKVFCKDKNGKFQVKNFEVKEPVVEIEDVVQRIV